MYIYIYIYTHTYIYIYTRFMSLLLTDEDVSLQVTDRDSPLVDASVRMLSDGDESSLAIGLAVMSPGGGYNILYYATLCYAILHYTMLCYAILCYTILC